MNSDLTRVMDAIADDVLQMAHIVMQHNGLKGSALDQNIRASVKLQGDSVVIETLFDNYIDYIEHGRKPRSGKQPPIDALRDWALKKGIPADNSTLFLIARAIWRDGYEGRPILATLESEIEKDFDGKWAEQIMEAITNELTNYFE